jgi:hypothetical protein
MQTKNTERAIGPKHRATQAQSPRTETRIRPDHAAHHGRSTPRDAATRRGNAQTQDGLSMEYQQGFFSSSSS